MAKTDFSKLKRPREAMPTFIRQALVENELLEAYRARPAYQQNDYLWWIKSAKREATREKRLAQMLKELKKGNRYMNMPYRG